MSAKILLPCALVLAVLGASVAPAQEKTKEKLGERPRDLKKEEATVGTPPVQTAPLPSSTDSPSPATHAPVPGELSSWIKYGRPGCCDPIGGDGPIYTELFVRGGPSLPVAGGIVNNTLALGWMITGGGRSMFFNPSQTAAWTVELSLSNITNNGNQPDLIFQLNPVPGGANQPPDPRTGSVRRLNRTFGSLGVGREWYLNGAANDFQHYLAFWRFGLDGGARLGTASMQFNEDRDPPENFQRTHDVFWAAYFALHTDVEIPCGGCCIFHTGFRAEWQYSWLDVFPFERRANLHDVNLLWTLGVRF